MLTNTYVMTGFEFKWVVHSIVGIDRCEAEKQFF